MGYAYAEVESIHARETVLKCGSDDGIKVWLNGEVVHEIDGTRAYEPNSDEVTIRLKDGTNRLAGQNLERDSGLGLRCRDS